MKNIETPFKTLADLELLEQTPLTEYNLPQNTYQMLQNGAALNPEKTALRFFLLGTEYDKSEDYTYRQFMEQINQTANMLHGLGIGKDDVVAYILPNLPETHFTIWGGEAAGIVCAINPLLEPDQMAEILVAAEAKVLVTLAPFPKTDLWQKVEPILGKVPSLKTVLTINLGVHLTGFKKTAVSLLSLFGKKIQVAPGQKHFDFHQLKKKSPKDKLSFNRIIQPNDIASYFHTGGTTGTPKIARHTHFNEVFDAWSTGQNIGGNPDRVVFCGLPLFHVNGVLVTGLIPWSAGATVVLGTPQGYRGEGVFKNFWKIVAHYKVSFFSGVPTVYQMLLEVPVENNDISSLEFAVCGAAPMPVETFRKFEEYSGVKILEGYGLTEGTCANAANPAFGQRKIGSIGLRNPYQLMKTVILDEETNLYVRDCETDEIGIVAIQGENVFAGYKEEIHNKNVWVDTGDGKKWLNTGDMGRMDADGYFWLTGRKKELIIRGGHNIDPKLIEDPLHTHPAVALAAAVGRPDARVGEVPVVYIQLKPNMKASVEELMEFAQNNIGEKAAIPKSIHLIETMPVTAVGKIFKPKLAFLEIQDAYTLETKKVEGVASVTVEVLADKVKGILAKVNVKAKEGINKEELSSKVSDVLGAYTIKYEVSVS